MASTGGNDWEVYYEKLKETGSMATFCFIFFIAFIQIALLNILTGIFVENAMKLAQPDRDTLALEHRKNELNEMEELRRMCYDIAPEDGVINAAHFAEHIKHGRLRAYLSVLGLDIKDAEIFFGMLQSASSNGEVEVESFVEGCMRLKGWATSIDMQSLLFETKVIHKTQRQFFYECFSMLTWLQESQRALLGTRASNPSMDVERFPTGDARDAQNSVS